MDSRVVKLFVEDVVTESPGVDREIVMEFARMLSGPYESVSYGPKEFGELREAARRLAVHFSPVSWAEIIAAAARLWFEFDEAAYREHIAGETRGGQVKVRGVGVRHGSLHGGENG